MFRQRKMDLPLCISVVKANPNQGDGDFSWLIDPSLTEKQKAKEPTLKARGSQRNSDRLPD
jgi:hypothetical protein